MFKIPSPARSQGAITPRRSRTRRTLSTASPAQSETRLSTVVEKFVNNEKFALSPMNRRSVLSDDTAIDVPRRGTWYKRVEGSCRDILEALDTNKMTEDMPVDETYEFEVVKDKQSQSSVHESSDNESVESIVVPQRRLFNQKKQAQAKFGDMLGSRKSLGKTNIEDSSIEVAPKTLFNKGPRNRPVFPVALLNSTNKTINKTVEPEPDQQARRNLFGQAGTKRKNMFTDFVISDSEEDSEVQHKVFDFKKNNKRLSLGTRNRRMPSLTPSMTTEIDIDDWNLLPSSTMIGAQEISGSICSDKDMELPDENHDDTLIDQNFSVNRDTNSRTHKNSAIQDDENDKTLTNENINDVHDSREMKEVINKSKQINKSHDRSKTKHNESIKDKTLQSKSSKRTSNIPNTNIEETTEKQHLKSAGKTLEDKMAELHGQEKENGENILSNRTVENPDNREEVKTCDQIEKSDNEQNTQNYSKTANNSKQNHVEVNKNEELLLTANKQETLNLSKRLSKTHQAEDIIDVLKNNKSKDEVEPNAGVQQRELEKISNINGSEAMNDATEKGKAEKEIKPTPDEEVEKEEHPKESSKLRQDKDLDVTSEKNETEEEAEPSDEEQENETEEEEEVEASAEVEENEEEVEENEDEAEENEEEEAEPSAVVENSEQDEEPIVEEDETEKLVEESEEEVEPSTEEQEKEVEIERSQTKKDEQEKESSAQDQENQDEDMEEMVWNDNDNENPDGTEIDAEAADATEVNQKVKKTDVVPKHSVNESRNLTNKSHRIVEKPVHIDPMGDESNVLEETPNNSPHDTTGRNRKKELSIIKSLEAILLNTTTDNESFRPIGRSTTFRKSKSVYETMHARHSLAPLQVSTLGSEGSRNSSTEGSEWDSHRTTRKTIRQTLGRDYTSRKSLRALVMEQSAKRQTEIYNKTHTQLDKTKNKSVLGATDKNASKIKITKNKTVVEDTNTNNASTINKTKNKTVLEDIRDQDEATKKNESPILNFSVHRTSIRHVPDTLIANYQASYHKSVHDIQEPELTLQNLANPEESMDKPINSNDSGPEISLTTSYGQGMSTEATEQEVAEDDSSGVEILDKESSSSKVINKEVSRRNASVFIKSIRNSEEVLDYEATEQEISDAQVEQVSLEQNEPIEVEEVDIAESENEEEVEQSEQEIEADSEQEVSEQDVADDSKQGESEQEIEPDSEQEVADESDQEEPESEQEQSQEIESDAEPSQHEIEGSENEDRDMSQDISQHESDQESDKENSRETENESDQADSDDDFISGLNSQCKTFESNRRGVSRIVFDSQMMSGDEIDFEGVSRQTDDVSKVSRTNDVSEQSEREPEMTRPSLSRVSDRVHDVSIGTKKEMFLMQMEKISQESQERKQKIKERLEKAFKPRNVNYNDLNIFVTDEPKYSIRRINQIEPKKPQAKPKRTRFPIGALPKAFVEDLKYKPPKRFQPANASWITKRLYKFLETKLEPRYDYKARVRAEELVRSIYSFTKLVRRRDVAPQQAIHELKREMARLGIVNTHHDFYEFFHDYMPREIRIKVNPDLVNKIPMPRNGVFSEIFQSRASVE